MNYFILAGEASGDLHGSNLIRAFKKKDSDFTCTAWGGDLMAAEGATITKHIRELAFMGFYEVIKNMPAILRNFATCKKTILELNPDAVILIDYPGFNLRIAQFCRKHGIQVFYYVSPTVWAWKKSRMFTIRDTVEKLFVILPFEKDFYASEGIEVDYFGHPIADQLDRYLNDNKAISETIEFPCIALLPGSRIQELHHALPIFNRLPEYFPEDNFELAAVQSVPHTLYQQYINHPRIKVLFNQTYPILQRAKMAVVTSGTATLETALFQVPQVVVYKTSSLSYAIGKKLVDIPFISLVNLIGGKQVVKELLQQDFTLEQIVDELKRIHHDSDYYSQMKKDYAALEQLVGKAGVNERIASRILELNQAGKH